MYKEVLDLLGRINLVVWLIAPLASFVADRFIKTPKTNGWRIVAIGSIFVIGRQVFKLIPYYDKAVYPPEVFLPYHMWRYLVGGVGALILLVGFSVILIDYLKLKAEMEAEVI